MTEPELVRRAKAGDRAAVAELLETVGLEQQQSQLGAANLNRSIGPTSPLVFAPGALPYLIDAIHQ